MMNRMIVGNLVHRPLRSLISVVAVALEVTMILLIVGLCLGMLQDGRTRTAGIGADVLVMPPGSSFYFCVLGSASIDQGRRRAGETASCEECRPRDHAGQFGGLA